MSGAIELASLALGTFPVVICLLDSFQQGYGYFTAWRAFRREYTEIVNRLRQEQILLRQHIEIMLRCVNETEFDCQVMAQSLEAAQWQSPMLNERLQEKLQGLDEYEVYKGTLASITLSLKEMESKLKKFEPQDKQPGALASKGLDLEEQFKRLRFTLRRTFWHRRVEDLGRQIDRVGKILGNAEGLAQVRRARGLSISQGFRKIRSQAVSLHTAISKGFTCTCKDEHAFKLLLADRTEPHPTDPETGSRLLRVAFPLRQRFWKKPWTLIHAKDTWCTTETTMMASSDGPQHINSGRDIVEESTIHSDSGKTASLSTRTTALTTPSLNSVIGAEAKPGQDGTGNTKLCNLSLSSQVQPRVPITDLCHRLHSQGYEKCLGHLPDDKGSWHQIQRSPSPSVTSSEFIRIVSLEAILNKEITDFHARKDIPLIISRRERMMVALTLAYALVELQLTPWISTSLCKADVYFFQRKDGTVVTRNPFFVCEVASTKEGLCRQTASLNTDEDHGNALLCLGILIMELWFGESIESKSWWQDSCGPNNEETQFTSFNAALTWQKDVQASGGRRLHEITQRCIYSNFGVTKRDLSDDGFAMAVFEGVIRELEYLVDCFDKALTMSGSEGLSL